MDKKLEQEVRRYWTGENVDCSEIWKAYIAGKDGYTQKFRSMDIVKVKIEFDLLTLD